jgi:cytochrome c biogenesis protein CcdA
VLLSHGLQHRIALLAAPLQAAGHRTLARLAPSGLAGQFLLGALLGTVWSPCIGPTLGAAIALAAQGKSVGRATVTMVFFGVGTALPLVLIGTISHRSLSRWRQRLNVASHVGHVLLGALLLAMGATILTGFDRYLEANLVRSMPDWINRLPVNF